MIWEIHSGFEQAWSGFNAVKYEFRGNARTVHDALSNQTHHTVSIHPDE